MSDIGLSIIAAECKSACAGESDLEKRISKSMAAVAKGHWMFCGDHEDDLRFRGAIGGVMLADETTQEEKDRITHILKQLHSLNCLMQEQEANPSLPLVKLWHEAKDAHK